MRDTTESSPDLIEARQRAGRMQETLNIELGLSDKQTFSSQGIASGGAIGGGVSQVTGGGSTVATSTGGGGGSGGLCFAGRTLVRMFDGSQITLARLFADKDFYIGDEVLSFDEDGVTRQGEILNVFESVANDYLSVQFNDDAENTVYVMPNHRFYIGGGQYREIKDLIGREVYDEWNELAVVTAIRLITEPQGCKMYNLAVKEFQNYVANGKRVHNRKQDPIIE